MNILGPAGGLDAQAQFKPSRMSIGNSIVALNNVLMETEKRLNGIADALHGPAVSNKPTEPNPSEPGSMRGMIDQVCETANNIVAVVGRIEQGL